MRGFIKYKEATYLIVYFLLDLIYHFSPLSE